MKFRAVIKLGGKTATGIEVPEKIVTGLGTGKRPPVVVTIRNYTYRTSIGVMGGKFMLPVSAEVRKNAGVEAGDEVDINIEIDTAPREVSVPADFSKALDKAKTARQVFDKLSYSHKLQHVLAIEQAKTPETRQRRIDKSISTLEQGAAK